MSEVSKKVAFLRGMAEGMELKDDSVQNRFLLKMLEALEEISEELETLKEHQDETDRYIDELDSDLGDLEEVVFEEDDADEDDEDGCSCGCHHHDQDDEDEDDEDAEGMDFIEYECPHCGTSVYYDQEAFDLEEEHLCPSCGKELFPNAPDED